MRNLDSSTVLLLILAAIIGAHLLVGLVAVVACLWHSNACTAVEWRFWFGEPMAAILGLLGGRAIELGKSKGLMDR